MKRMVFLIVAAFVLSACPANDGSPAVETLSATASTPAASPSEPSPSPTAETPEALDVSGTWVGTWANTTPDQSTGTFRIEWDQSLAADLEGTITIAGTPCLSGGKITGSLDGQAVKFGAVNGEVEVAYDGSVNGNGSAMSGTYSTSCGNAEGSWDATKVG